MRRHRYGLNEALLEAVMVLITALFAAPLYLLLVFSVRRRGDLETSAWAFPARVDLSNFSTAWTSASLGPALLNSILVTVVSGVMVIGIGSMAAYYLARSKTRLSYGLYLLFLAGLIVPFQLGLVPLYQSMRDLNLLGTPFSLILFYLGNLMPFTVFLYAGFLRALPASYEEAARIDGATHLQAFTLVVFPLLRPVTGTVLILNAIGTWNDFFTPMLYTGGTKSQTLPVAIYAFVGQFSAQWELVFAGLLIAIMPILIVYFLLQRSIIQGFASGVKG
jgi:raffinose/stachyose/melibiose transport system permease protein